MFEYYTYTINYKGINDLFVATNGNITATSKKDFKTAIKNLKRKLKK